MLSTDAGISALKESLIVFPTSIVSTADISVKLKNQANRDSMIEIFKQKERYQKLEVENEGLIGKQMMIYAYLHVVKQVKHI